MTMELYVLDSNYTTVAVIDDYTSLIWAKRYSQFGDCELYVRACEDYIDVLRKGQYLLRNDDDMICRIESVEIETDVENGNYLIVVGKDCRSILGQRIVWFQTNFSGTVEDYVRRLITENIVSPETEYRQIDNFVLGPKAGLTDKIVQQVTYDRLDEKIIEVCTAYNYGSRVVLNDNNQFEFTLYKGVDRSYNQETNDYVVFSDDFDNIISSRYKTDNSNFRNVMLVAGEGEGINRKRYSWGTASGLDRYELFVDANDLSSETLEGVTIEYASALRARGLEALAEHGIVESFEGEVEPNYSYKYGIDYQLGDVVQVINTYGISSSVRITEVIETFDEDGYSVIPTFAYQEVITDD